MTELTISTLAQQFRLHPDAVQFFLGARLAQLKNDAKSLSDLRETMPAPLFHQITYNLDHVRRGKILCDIALTKIGKIDNPKVLDIGCGIGGTLVAFGDAGFTLCGIELSESRAEICKKNLGFNNYSADIYDMDLCVQGLDRKFDVVVCNSVIEHVNDPAAMIRTFKDLLTPGGVVIMGVANCEALGNALSDPHYGMFGLTYTPPGVAEALYRLLNGSQSYSVTEWKTIEWYRRQIERSVGFAELVYIDSDNRDLSAVPSLLKRLGDSFESAVKNEKLDRTPDLKNDLISATAEYMGDVCHNYASAVGGNLPPDIFIDRYIRKSFQIVGSLKD